MEIFISSTNELKKLAKKLAQNIESKLGGGVVITLRGELGSGKTTFVGFFVEALSINDRVQSPTFVLVREYGGVASGEGVVKKVYHLDLYRLKHAEEVAELGLEEMINDRNAVTIIEWPELARDILETVTVPEKLVGLEFEHAADDENARVVTIKWQNNDFIDIVAL